MKRAVMIAILFLPAAALDARAAPGCVYQDAYLFSSPDYVGGLIGTIPAPAPVEVVQRGKKWSLISYDGQTGYVSTSHLSRNSRAQADPPPSVYDESVAAPTPFWTGSWGPDWTSRTEWSRESAVPPSDPAWAACGGSSGAKPR
ncbi:SH3 domain-containing protein [Methylocystis sp. S23]|jgi:hypothetical protein